MTGHIDPSQTAGRALMMRGLAGPVVMLNLLRFRQIADYAGAPALAPPNPISGAAAYDLYVARTLPWLAKTGGAVVFDGDGDDVLVGPDDERWDRVMLIQQASIDSFMAFADNPDYLAGLGHRRAALSDSRLLPMVGRYSTAQR
jgi:uncharacterized protein (DUF1330 family)